MFRASLVLLAPALLSLAVAADGTSAFKPTERAFYASPDQINFVRPGLVVTVSKAEIATDGTIRAWVRMADPRNLPLDREGITTPGPITLSFLIGTIPADGTQYTSYITRSRTAGSRTVTQATSDSNGTWQKVADGEYVYTFGTKAPADMDRSATHTIGVYGSRNLTEFDMGTSRADTVFSFVPAGAAVTKVRDVVRTSSCNKCHDQLNFHGGNRRSVEVCNICHTPQTPDSTTGNPTDFKVMIHKIHRGASLPSVIAKNPYKLSTRDYSTVVNPAPGQACVVCHEATTVSGAKQADRWFTAPSREACGSCHDNVNFATGQNHPLPQVSDNQCTNCHTPVGENDFDVSIRGAHVVPTESSLLDQIKFTIERVEDVGPGKNPTVTFTLKDKHNRPIKASDMTNLRLYMGGPTADITSYVREDALKADGPGDGRYFWTFVATMPANASGTWQFGIEGYRNTVLLPGTERARTVRDVGQNKVVYASAGGPAVPRRTVVTTAKCNQCHYSISFHGGNRNTVEQCTFCHNPTLTEGTPAESFNFPNMIHRFHAEARYPGNLNNCAQCHVGDSQSLPLPANLLSVRNGLAPLNPTPPTTNACQGCHGESAPFWSHAQSNITALGESCSVCHGRNADLAVNKVHAQ